MRLFALFFGFAAMAAVSGCSSPATVWRFDDLNRIGGAAVQREGDPRVIGTAAGKAVAFDGVKDALFLGDHPLAGAKAFTIEAVFRPDGGAFEQRWLHLAEIDPKTGLDSGNRFLFEIRVVKDRWYLDAFTTGDGYRQTLAVPQKTFPVGRWYRVAMTGDGAVFRSYVDGVLQSEAPLAYRPQGKGHSSLGVRINKVNYFHGAVLNVRFTPRALAPGEFAPLPEGLNGSGKSE